MVKKLKIIGITFSISFLAFISLSIFIKAMGLLFADWFSNNSLIIAIISGIFVFLLLVTGSISFGAFMKKGKGIFD